MANWRWRGFKSFSWTRAMDDGTAAFGSALLGAGYGGLNDAQANANSIVMSAARWAARNFIEPKLTVFVDDVPDPNHPLSKFLAAPMAKVDQANRDTMDRINQGIVLSLGILSGNAYIHKLRDGNRMVGIQYIPHTAVMPVAKPGQPGILQHYQVSFNGGSQIVQPDDMIHIKEGWDPSNTLLGMSPIASVLRHILADNEASVYSHAVLKNMGVASHSLTPDMSKGGMALGKDQLDSMLEHWKRCTTGEARGGAFASSQPINVQKIGFSPEELALDKMVRTPEERISAVLLIPAIVLGLGAGLDRSTMANYKEALVAATENFLVPLWSLVAEALTPLVLEIGGPWTPKHRLGFDLSVVKALQEDVDAKFNRAKGGFDSGFLTRGEAREIVGLKAEKYDNVYKTDLIQVGVKPTPAQKAAEEAQLNHVPKPA